MRMIYTTPRLENADRVVDLFLEHEIAARVKNDGGWRGRGHRRFSYFGGAAQRATWPQVWVIRPEDFPKARALLRELDIEPAVRHGEQLENKRLGIEPSSRQRRRATVNRIRRVLLAIVGALVVVTMIRMFG